MFDSISKYPMGSVWMYSSTRKKSDYADPEQNHDFLTTRPVIIVSKYSKLHDRVQVVPTTTNQSMPGFDVVIPVGGSPIGRICPYDETIASTEYLTTFIGMLDPHLFKAVMDAIAYHHGFSNEIPPYITEDEILSLEMRNAITSGTYTEYLASLATPKSTYRAGDHVRQFDNIEMKMRAALNSQKSMAIPQAESISDDTTVDDRASSNDRISDNKISAQIEIETPKSSADEPIEDVKKSFERTIEGIVTAKDESHDAIKDVSKTDSTTPKKYLELGYPKEFDKLSQVKLDIIRSGDIDKIMKEFGKSRGCATRWAGQIKTKDGVDESPSDYNQKITDLSARVKSKSANLKFLKKEDAQIFCTIDVAQMKDLFGISRELGKSYQKMYLTGKRGSL